MRGVRNRWVVALKIARRSALTSWGRSLLIVALIAAPIMGLSAAAVVLPSRQSTPAERVQGTLGHAQAVLHVVAGPGDKIEQTIEADGYSSNSGAMAGSSADDRRVDPRTVLPAGTRLIATGYDAATFARGSGAVSLAVETGETWDPSLDGGPYVLLSGRRPSTADEVLVSPAALARLGAHVGGTITMTTPTTRTLTVVGTSRDRAQPSSAQTVFAASSALPETDVPLDSVTFYVPSLPIDWAMVRRLNAIGTTVFSRQVVLDPVPPSTGASMGDGGSAAASTTVVIALALVFALLEVALLAGSAFLVGARLQQRTLAIIASVGADRSVLRRVVTANGVVLGAIGGVAGVGLGIVAALVVMRLTDDGAWTRYPGVHIVWPVLAGIVAFGVLVGWLAALVPARAAARFDVVRALRGARTPQSVGKKPVLGVVLLAVGVALTILGSGALVAALKVTGPWETAAQLGAVALLGGGPVVAQIGVLLCAGLVLRGVARLLARGPLPGRLAARDTSRNLGRAVPAVASVMTTLFVASFAMCIANTASIDSSRYYSWTAAAEGRGVALIASSTTGPPSDADARRWVDALSHDLPITSTAVLATTPQGSSDAHPSNRARDAQAVVHFPERPGSCTEQRLMDLGDLRCGPFTSSGGSSTNAQNAITIGNEAGLTALLGHSPSAEASAALQHGGAVGLRSDLAPRGTATLEWFTPKQLMEFSAAQHPKRSAHVETVVDLPAHPLQDALFMTPATAKTLGIAFAPHEALLSFARTPTQSELDSANAALDALANSPDGTFVTIENGPQDFGSQIAWYVLLACLIIAISAGATAVGLARVDGRADDLTLASLGASPRIRRSVAFVQGLIVCGVGAVIGTALGLLPAVAISAASVSYAFAPPVLQLVLTAVGIPLVIAAGSYLLVGGRGADLTRRAAIA